MPRPKRHVSRCHSIPTEPPIVPKGHSNVARRSEPVPEPLPNDEPHSNDDDEPHSSTKQNPRPCRRKSNKYWTVDLKDENGEITKARLRVNDVFVLLEGKKIVLEWNELGQPIRESGGLLEQLLGHVASEFTNFPISYIKWSKIPTSCKNHVWNNIIQDKFDVSDEGHKKYIMGSLRKKWMDNCSRLFTKHYDLALSWEANLEKRPAYIPRDQWARFLEYRMSETTQLTIKKNIKNQSKQKISHTLGSMSIARKMNQIEMKTGRTGTRAEMYAISHKKKDGSYVNDNIRQKILHMQSQLSSEDDASTTVFGKEHPRRVRTVSQCVCRSQMFGSTGCVGGSLSSNYILKSEFDADMEKMQKKMKENDAEIKSLKSALAYMMQYVGSSLPSVFPNINQVDGLGSPAPIQTLGDFRQSSSSSHEPQNQDSSSQLA
ncbi:hypothetical protein CDL12_14809 [Handroanthus impetiginosus]|uniref:Transposase Tnp1/En/Spm-like domain-containing protein n=1 Tax=Handroanthus impetiginosus TaxID=429701 RepID=A0A2G9H508_9LAMI|nr:hypothetical protein CDL12_14809 [Handroanthus impetiginosus]